MEYIEKCELTTLCLVYDEDKILVQNRLKEDWKGIVLPGGHVDKEESFVEAIIREIKEETNLDIYNPKLVGIKQFQEKGHRYITFLFKTNEFEGNLKSSDEGEVMWVKRSNLQDLDLVEDFIDLLSVFEDDDKQEFMYVEAGESFIKRIL
ncbi:MAG: 8-oxo-dGTP diphosphatase [Lactobacillus sp.]|nr:8-oxo-dGTP diphosphatase [Lactobacillus sp.]